MCGIGGYFLKPGASWRRMCSTGWKRRWRIAAPTAAGVTPMRMPASSIRGCRSSILPTGRSPSWRRRRKAERCWRQWRDLQPRALRAERTAPGYGFTSNSDCETVLALWARHGTDSLNRLRGMYAAALYDPATARRACPRPVRDQAALYRRNRLRHRSSLRRLRPLRAAIGEHRRSRPGACRLHHRQAACPGRPAGFCRHPPRRPGRDPDDPRRPHRRATLRHTAGRPVRRHRPADPGAFQAALQDSVEAHLMADVPLGLFFSGGVDSSAILAALADLRARDGMRNRS